MRCIVDDQIDTRGKSRFAYIRKRPLVVLVAFGIDDILVMREVDFPELNIEGKNAGVAKIAREDPCALPFEHPEFYDIKWTVSYCFEVRLINFSLIAQSSG